MSRTLIRRLERLERQGSSSFGNVHVMLAKSGDDDETFNSRVEAFKASLPNYDEDRDTLLCVQFVSPEQVRARQEAA